MRICKCGQTLLYGVEHLNCPCAPVVKRGDFTGKPHLRLHVRTREAVELAGLSVTGRGPMVQEWRVTGAISSTYWYPTAKRALEAWVHRM